MAIAALAGCRHRAYTDLYVENMAAEIRELEDQLYEYDHEYRLLEQELEVLRQQNWKLKSLQQSAGDRPQSHSPLQSQQRSSSPGAPERDFQSILENDRKLIPPISPNGIDDLPAPGLPKSPIPDLPESKSPSLQPPLSPDPGVDPRHNDFDFDAPLLPPTIDPGEPIPPPMSTIPQSDRSQSLLPENNLELNLSRIEVPGLLASASLSGQTTNPIAAEKVTDMRIVELAFHPSLSRAINLDERADTDGLYLVLQPKNERGQLVPTAAQLSIVVLDPSRERGKDKIGRWDYSAADVQTKFQPIGTSQGIHLTLPWEGPDPAADRVIVFALYTFENGRQVMGEKEIFVSSDGEFSAVWAPRATTARAVAAAQYEAGRQPANVVRPAAGAIPLEPAPLPSEGVPPR